MLKLYTKFEEILRSGSRDIQSSIFQRKMAAILEMAAILKIFLCTCTTSHGCPTVCQVSSDLVQASLRTRLDKLFGWKKKNNKKRKNNTMSPRQSLGRHNNKV